MRLSWSHDPSHEFVWLTWVHIYVFFYFFYFILQHWIDFELSFIMFQFVFYGFIPISWSRFDRLTWVSSTYFLVEFCFQFHPSTLSWLRIELNNFCICFLYIGLLGFYDLCSRFDRSTWVDPSWSNIFSFQYLKNQCHLDFFS